MVMLSKRQNGFTIVELLIVVVIIGILSALVIVIFSGAQAKARDTQHINDLKNIQKTVEAYYAVNGTYPASASGSWSGHCPSYGNYDTYIIGVSPEFIKALPTDPVYDTGHLCYLYRSNGTDYMAIAHFTMESICGGDPSNSCNPSYIQALDRVGPTQPTIAVYSPGAIAW